MTAQTWIPLIPSKLIETGEVTQFLVQDVEVAVWRSAQGHVQIWQNRCPHRSVRLSLGTVKGESLVCAYHGWQFAAADGHCQRIPAQPEQRAPKSLCVKTYQAREYLDFIWFGGDSLPPNFPVINELKHAAYAGSIQVNTTFEQVKHYLAQNKFALVNDACEYVWMPDHETPELYLYVTPTTANTTSIHAMQNGNTVILKRNTFLDDMRDTLQPQRADYA